jgi:hypothetical protein
MTDMAKVGGGKGGSFLGNVFAGIVGGVIVETTRQVGTGIREYYKDKRKAMASQPAYLPTSGRSVKVRDLNKEPAQVEQAKPTPQLYNALIGLGFKKDAVIAAIASPDVQETAGQDISTQVKVALKVLTP